MELISIDLNFTKKSVLKKWPCRISKVENSLDGKKKVSNTVIPSPSSAQASHAESSSIWWYGYVCTCLQCQVLPLVVLPDRMLSVTCCLAI